MGALPGPPDWAKDLRTKFGDRFNRIESRISFLETSRGVEVTARGGLPIKAGGSLTVVDTAGHVIAIIGTQPDGTIGSKTYRQNGTVLWESMGAGVFGLQYTATRDVRGTAVLAEDPVQGGLQRPRVPLGQWVPNAAMGANPTPATSATWVTVDTLFGYQQSPFARFNVRVSSSAVGATGNWRIMDPSGVQVGTNQAVAANTTADAFIGPLLLPSWPTSQDVPGSFLLQVQLTAGTGNIGARGLGAWGAASFDTV